MPRKAKAASVPRAAGPSPLPKSGPSYWLFKTEPEEHSWEMQKARGKKGEPWTGVRNFVARNNMKAMRWATSASSITRARTRRSSASSRCAQPAHPDAKDETGVWKCVDVRAVCDMPKPVTLAAAKANPKLADMALVRTARLSVQPVHARRVEGSVPHGRPRSQDRSCGKP